MAGKNKKQKTISFRLNMERDEERELYEEIQKHSGGIVDERYGSSGAYIKKVLLANLENEIVDRERLHLQEELEVFKQVLLEAQEAMMLRILREQVTVEARASERVGNASVVTPNHGDENEELLPEEAFSYLSSL